MASSENNDSCDSCGFEHIDDPGAPGVGRHPTDATGAHGTHGKGWLCHQLLQPNREAMTPTDTKDERDTLPDMQKMLTQISERLDEMRTRSFPDLERSVASRLDQEKEYLRDKLADAMRLILDKLDRFRVASEGSEQTRPKEVHSSTDHHDQTKPKQAYSSTEQLQIPLKEGYTYRPGLGLPRLKHSLPPRYSLEFPEQNDSLGSMPRFLSPKFDSTGRYPDGYEQDLHHRGRYQAYEPSDQYQEIKDALSGIQDKLTDIQESSLQGLMAEIIKLFDQNHGGAVEKDDQKIRQVLKKKQELIDEQAEVIEVQRHVIKEKERIIEEKHQVVKKKQNAIKGKQSVIKEKQKVIKEQQMMMKEKQRIINEQQEVIEEKREVVTEKQKLIEEKQAVIEEKQTLVEVSKMVIEEKQKLIDDRNNVIEEQERIIEDMQAEAEAEETNGSEEELIMALTAFSTGKCAHFKRNKRKRFMAFLHLVWFFWSKQPDSRVDFDYSLSF